MHRHLTIPTTPTQHTLAGSVKKAESFWTVDEGQLHIQLTKAVQVVGVVWLCVLFFLLNLPYTSLFVCLSP